MKKIIALLSGVSIAALVGFSNITLADEEEAAEETKPVAVEGDETDEELRTRAKGKKSPGDEDGDGDEAQGLNSTGNEVALETLAIKAPDDGDGDEDDTPKGSGDPMKGLLGGKGVPCKPCDVPFGGTVSTGEDDGDEVVKEKDLPEQADDKAREATSKEKKKEEDDKKKKKD
ncbi:MAG: hypothetical protein V3R64_04975 [Sphingomonadales bacterium]